MIGCLQKAILEASSGVGKLFVRRAAVEKKCCSRGPHTLIAKKEVTGRGVSTYSYQTQFLYFTLSR